MHENGHGIIDGEHCRPVPPAPRGHAAAGQQQPADASRLVVRPVCGPGSLPARMHEDGRTPQRRRGRLTRCLTPCQTPPPSPNRASGQKGGGRSRPLPLRWRGSDRPVQDEKPEQRQRKMEAGGLTPPTTVFLTPLPICASIFARPRTRPPLRPRRGPDNGAASDRHLGGGQPDGGPRRRAIDGPARRRPGGCALGELAQVQEPIEREEQQVSTETNERDKERTDQVGNEHGHERDQSARRIGDRAASTTDTGERVTLGNRHPVTAADHRNQSARATSITPAHLPANPHSSG